MGKGRELIPGFQEEIHPGVWNRHLLWGAPQKWAHVWIGICLFGLAYIIYNLPFKAVFPLAGVWLVGHSLMTQLTKWDPQWDDVLLQSLFGRRYKKRYLAG
jgi:type IV secretory pathway TrbD component